MRLDGAAGATGQVYEPDGILGFISVINGPSLSVLWKERGVLGSGSIGFAFRKRNASITFESRALTLVFVVCDANRSVPFEREEACFAAINPSRGRPYAPNSILIMNFSAFKIEF